MDDTEPKEKNMKSKGNDVKLSYLSLFRFGTFWEKAATCLGVLLAFMSGMGLTASVTVFGEMNTAFVERTHPPTERASTRLPMIATFGGGRRIFNETHEENMAALLEDMKAYALCTTTCVVIGVLLMMLGVVLISWSALRQITTIRMLFLRSVLRQDLSWFDTDMDFNLASKMSEDMAKLRDGIGDKLASVSNLLGSDLVSLCVAFSLGWRLSLACVPVVPIAIASAIALNFCQAKSANLEMESYKQAGKHAEETLKSIRTVVAFGGERVEAKRYRALLRPAELYGHRRVMFSGLNAGLNWVLIYIVTAICISYGSRLVVQDRLNPEDEQHYFMGSVITISFNMFMVTQIFTMCMPFLEVFAGARSAATSIFHIIDRIPKIDSFDGIGISPTSILGDISLENVHFSYPARPDVKVLNNFSLHIKRGECVALVGSSGCGKTTVLQLLQRLYEPAAGAVRLDGTDLRDLNLRCLRSSFGVVGQEPVLFRGTIYDNIAIGHPGATLEDVHRAASMANAHDFINHLPKGYDTVVGERGACLSGGQRQRVALARALLRAPPLLLLDEPTAALDAAAARALARALRRAARGRTTLLVSHRLVTVNNHSNASLPEEIAPSLEETQKDDSAEATSTKLCTKEHNDRRMSSLSNGSTMSLEPQSLTVTPQAESEDHTEDVCPMTGWQIMKLNAPEWKYITIGSIAAFAHGSCFSISGVIMGYFSGIFVIDDEARMLYLADLYAGLYFATAVVVGVCMYLESYTFTVAGLKMTSRLRIQYYTALMKQEMGFYDKQSNTVGALCARLSGDTASVQNATGVMVGIVIQGVSSVFVGVCTGLYYDWRLTLVLTAFLPVIVGSCWLEGRMSQQSQIDERNALEAAVSVATEAIISVRTVQSLGVEETFLDKFKKSLYEARAAISHTSWLRGLVMGLGLYMPLASCVTCYYYGTTLVIDEKLEYEVILSVSQILVFGAYILGQALLYTSSSNNINIAAARILATINREPLIQTHCGVKDTQGWSASGSFSFKNVEFSYPTREQQALRGIDVRVGAGETLALVGPSGCGKSTLLQLLQRFYDPDTGAIELDGANIVTSLSLGALRRQLGAVSQEAPLFDRSLADNVAYGAPARRVHLPEVVAACRAANVHAFIASLPQGYFTLAGAGGARLSGGQRQRVCVTRALLRAPRILLLDEPTAALDAASERAVTEALGRAAQGRTCVIVAHRLSTIQHADLICVLDKGTFVEKGTHAELMKLKGLYYRMHEEQNIE